MPRSHGIPSIATGPYFMQAESYMGLQTAAVPSPVALPGSLTVLHTDNLPTDKKTFYPWQCSFFPAANAPHSTSTKS